MLAEIKKNSVWVVLIALCLMEAVGAEPRKGKEPQETELDLPGSFVRYFDYGERVNAWRARYGIDIREDLKAALNSPGAR